MKHIILMLILLCSSVYAAAIFPVYVRNRPVDSIITLELNYTENPDCSGVLLSDKQNIAIDDKGVGYMASDIGSLTTTPSYICEYEDGVLKYVHTWNTKNFIGYELIFNDVTIDNLNDNRINIEGNLSFTGQPHINASGTRIYFSDNIIQAKKVEAYTTTASQVPLVAKGASGQTAALTSIRPDNGSNNINFNADGTLDMNQHDIDNVNTITCNRLMNDFDELAVVYTASLYADSISNDIVGYDEIRGNNIYAGSNYMTASGLALLNGNLAVIFGDIYGYDDLFITDDIEVGDRIAHQGDTDTLIQFNTDHVEHYVGGVEFMDFTEGTSDIIYMGVDIITNGDLNMSNGNINPSICDTAFLKPHTYERTTIVAGIPMAVGNGNTVVDGDPMFTDGYMCGITGICTTADGTNYINMSLAINSTYIDCYIGNISSTNAYKENCQIQFTETDRIGCYPVSEVGAVSNCRCVAWLDYRG